MMTSPLLGSRDTSEWVSFEKYVMSELLSSPLPHFMRKYRLIQQNLV